AIGGRPACEKLAERAEQGQIVLAHDASEFGHSRPGARTVAAHQSEEVAGAKDDRRDAHVLADALRTDRHCFRRLTVEDPVVIELREWSRMAEDLSQERNRLANRVREQLWRYYPQALELGDDLAADWFLDLWVLAPTPAKAVRLRESRVTSLLKAHRIRRLEAAEVLRILRQKPLVVRQWRDRSSDRPHHRRGGAPQTGEPTDKAGASTARRTRR